MPSYSDDHIAFAWETIRVKFPKPEYITRIVLFNALHNVRKPFLDITPQDCLQTSAAATFSAISAFKDNDIEEPSGKRGALIFTEATATCKHTGQRGYECICVG